MQIEGNESMRNVTVAKTAGFCFGVKRAVDQVNELAQDKSRRILTYGPIIHNEEVVREFEEKGVHVLDEDDDLKNVSGATVVIRSHGVGPQVYEKLIKAGCEIADATCPFVERIHKLVRKASEEGKTVVIAGNPDHPEVQGISAFSLTPVFCIETAADIDRLSIPKDKPVFLAAQTTFNYKKFEDIVEKFEKKEYDTHIVNTICNATQERQEEARRIAQLSDVMFVIGGKSSSNTQKLVEICRNECASTYYIQTAADIRTDVLHDGENVGITAGASTPRNIIEEVKTKCQN